ncbi:MAG TPA: selenium metabolism-associated LysR family transcriptional regulator [Planctomycetota bacterium]|nr:selenium metabolism-associated LysR family transcriptional regulator [Planctomycetota bacterium]
MSVNDPLSIRQLEVFVALVEKGSFTRAARHLVLSQSTVSGHMADLERRLGVRLVERERSGVRPTPAGRALLVPARQALQAERGARMAVQELSGLLRGALVVGGSTIPASYILPALFGRFHKEHPGVSLRLLTGDSRDVLEQVRHATIEIGMIGSAPDASDVRSTKIGEDSLTLVAGIDHPLAGRVQVQAADLLQYAMVMREEGSGTRAATTQALRKLLGPEGMAKLAIACEVGSAEAQKAAVREGLGLAFVSNLAIRDDLSRGNLVALRVRGFDVRRSFHLVSRAEELLSPAAKAFRTLAIKATG